MVWPSSSQVEKSDWSPDTGISEEELLKVGKASVVLPDNFVSRFPPLSSRERLLMLTL